MFLLTPVNSPDWTLLKKSKRSYFVTAEESILICEDALRIIGIHSGFCRLYRYRIAMPSFTSHSWFHKSVKELISTGHVKRLVKGFAFADCEKNILISEDYALSNNVFARFVVAPKLSNCDATTAASPS
ncbi:hypothetical protein CEXT_280911 [Caerostris extrusa]|uniref:LAGLIDADG homing endonuclease n=1 Tax=Caerostris extrusa TaxID=172846 RepID=A0AAV4PEA2_CAEEX|nr:hypothetical protein CEXT_280911 [Caerostris extrusa]